MRRVSSDIEEDSISSKCTESSNSFSSNKAIILSLTGLLGSGCGFFMYMLFNRILHIKRWTCLMAPNLSRPKSRHKVGPRARTSITCEASKHEDKLSTFNVVLVCGLCKVLVDVICFDELVSNLSSGLKKYPGGYRL